MISYKRITRNHIRPLISCYYSTKKEINPSTKMPMELTKDTDVFTKEDLQAKIKKSSEELKWRTPWHEREGQHYSMLRVFYSEHNNTDLMKLIQGPVDFSPAAIKQWWEKRKETRNIMLQQYLPERNQLLGNELAASHFIVHRGGAVKFFGQNHWIKANQLGTYALPNRYQEDIYLQAIDCTGVNLYYEGLVNFRDLHQVEWFSVNGCRNMDDWCMDRITHIFGRTLLYLDVRECPKITFRGLGAIAKMEKLKILYVDNILYNDEFEMTCLMLQEINPDLDIRTE